MTTGGRRHWVDLPATHLTSSRQTLESEPSKKVSSNRNQMNEHGVCFFHVHVYKGRDLGKDYETGGSQTHVVLRLGGNHNEYTQTRGSPNWNQAFKYPKNKIQAPTVEIELEGQSRSKANLFVSLGMVVFDLEQLSISATPLSPHWYRLRDRKGNMVTAELLLAIWIDDDVQSSVSPPAFDNSTGDQSHAVMGSRFILPKFWYIRVHIIEADDLKVPSYSENVISAQEQPNLHVLAMLGNQSERTGSSSSSGSALNPQWNADFTFVACEPFEEPLVLTVEERGELRSTQVCGRCVVPLKKLPKRFDDEHIASRWYDLSKLVVDEKDLEKLTVFAAGRIHVKVYVDAGYRVLGDSFYQFVPPEKGPFIGSIEFHVIGAFDLSPMKNINGRETADAYCVIHYREKWGRTKTIVDSLNPQWNEQYSWQVFDPCSHVTIGLFDDTCLGENRLYADKRFGKVRIDLSTLPTSQQLVEQTYPILCLKPSGLMKMGEIKVAVKLTFSSWAGVLSLYSQPLLPNKHYLDCRSKIQRNLANSVLDLVCRSFDQAEPRIRRDVLEYMWAGPVNYLWSWRKMKANLSIYMGVMQWYEEMRTWKNPRSALLIHVFLVVLLLSPRILPSAIFLSLCLFAILNYRYRPQQRSEMDLQLSLFHFDQDDLEEELDTFPTTASQDIVIMRYDRLRGIAARLQNMVGDLASRLEGCLMLVCWTDPRASKIFMVFCLIAVVVLYYVPHRVLLFVLGLYMARHPRRSILPSAPANFISRLPHSADTML